MLLLIWTVFSSFSNIIAQDKFGKYELNKDKIDPQHKIELEHLHVLAVSYTHLTLPTSDLV